MFEWVNIESDSTTQNFAKTIYQNVRKHKPAKGLVQMLTVTEKQYANIEYLVGTSGGEYLNSIDPLVII